MVLHRIIATGGHSGLGVVALRHFLRNPPSSLPPPYHIILYARDIKPTSAAQRVADEFNALQLALPDGDKGLVEVRAMDLASMSTVEREATRLRDELEAEVDGKKLSSAPQLKESGEGQIDIFFLNAAYATAKRTVVQAAPPPSSAVENKGEQPFELSALVNHYAHIFFLDILKDAILRGQRRTRIQLTGSGLHRRIPDPVSDVLAEHYDPTQEVHKSYGMVQHYGHSKFLQLVGTLALVDKLRALSPSKPIEVVYSQPGFIPNTGLSREGGLMTRIFMNYILPLLPISAVATLDQGGLSLCRAFSAKFDDLPQSEAFKPEGGRLPQAQSNVTFAHVINEVKGKNAKKAVLAKEDPRAHDAALKEKWWPKGCFEA